MKFDTYSGLLEIRDALDRKEVANLSHLATFSREGVRRHPGEKIGHRQSFSLDTDRILHSRAYTRYIDKTQVFYLINNDHITHRVLHVQLVSKIARTIGRFLGLNEDLIEAIALGHDIGHPPFGHDGETMLSRLCVQNGLPPFQHNVQSVIFLDRIEKGGRGWNLTLQTLDGILCHDGEVHDQCLSPDRQQDFVAFDRKLASKIENPQTSLAPMTLEGCIVRFADTIAYIGRDIEDAIELGMISRDEIPASCREVLGSSNGTIVYRLVSDLIGNGIAGDRICFSPAIAAGLAELKEFNYRKIYLNPAMKKQVGVIEDCYRKLFDVYLRDLSVRARNSAIFTEFLDDMGESYIASTPFEAIVRDFIAGMTDDYFVSQAAINGCKIPERHDYPR